MKIALVFATLFAAAPLAAGTWSSDSVTSAQGTRGYQLYVPAGYAASEKRPLLVAIHGCTETPAEFAALSRVAALADAQRLLVLMPAQSALANPSLCWNWFLPANQKRGEGEPSLIKGMIDRVSARYSVDPARVYVMGVSSGGYMTSILLSCYSDVFAAGMVASGGMYKGASDVYSGALAALQGSPADPKASGRDAYRCSGSAHPRLVPVLVFHGDLDPYVAALNGRQVVEQFIQTNDLGDDGVENGSIGTTPIASQDAVAAGGLAYTWTDYGFGTTTVVRHLTVPGMGHAWSGGDPQFPYAEPNGPDETAIMWDFVKQFRRGETAPRRRVVR